jgi:hypothetical protein
MKPLNNTITGWTAIAAGIATFSIPIGLAVLAETGSLSNIVGALGDVLGAIAAVLIIPVLVAAGGIVMAKHKALGLSAQSLGVIGALIDFTQYVLFIGGIITYEQSLPWNSTARGLIGIVVLTYGLLNRKDPKLKRLYVWLSIALGVVMAPGVMAVMGVNPLGNVFDELAQGGTLAEANPILIALLFIMAPIFVLGWPIWLLWTGRLFLKEK